MLTKIKMPCVNDASLVWAPAFILTELRTITAEIGSPPIKPLIILPSPCASNSRSAGATLRKGSSLSAASRLKRDSMLAIKARVTPVKRISDLKSKKIQAA